MSRYCECCGREGSIKNFKGKDYCRKHYEQIKTHGFCLEENSRDKEDPNEIIKHENYYTIKLYDDMQEEIDEEVIIDKDDYDKVKGVRFDLNRKCVTTKINDSIIMLQNYLLDTNDRVEFVNGNYLDFRRENLKIVKKEIKIKKNPYMISKKDKNKIIIEFIGNSRNGVVGSCVLISYPVGKNKYEKILLENGMIQKNGALKDEYCSNKEVMSAVMSIGNLEGVFLSHAHL